MLRLVQALALLLCLCGAAAFAQTYTPKQIRIEGTGGADTAELMRIAALKPGSMTKQEIEAAMQRLADTGMFTDIVYTVNDDALVFKMTMAPAAQALPVRFANLVWWTPQELEQMLEARVPTFHGKLPLTGTLTDQVEAALVALLHDKGVADAKVEAIQAANLAGGPSNAVDLTVTRPQILLGDVHVAGVGEDGAAQLIKTQGLLGGQDFDLHQTPTIVKNGVTEIFQNAGFLDFLAGDATFAPPRKDMDRYLIDVDVPASGTALYRVSHVELHAAAPVSKAELDKVMQIKAGDRAGLFELRVQKASLTQPYYKYGYLDAEATLDAPKDTANHKVAYSFTMVPGEQYRVERVDTSALTADQQAAFASRWHKPAGELLDEAYTQALGSAIADLHSAKAIGMGMRPDRKNHTVVLVLAYATARK